MLWRNEGKFLIVVLRIEEFINKVSVAKAQMLAVGEQLGLSTVVIMLYLCIAGSAISLSPQVSCETGLQPILARTYYTGHLTSFLSGKECFWMRPFQ